MKRSIVVYKWCFLPWERSILILNECHVLCFEVTLMFKYDKQFCNYYSKELFLQHRTFSLFSTYFLHEKSILFPISKDITMEHLIAMPHTSQSIYSTRGDNKYRAWKNIFNQKRLVRNKVGVKFGILNWFYVFSYGVTLFPCVTT